ncbi:hypothetical protein JTE90_023740 [Oedothorax gibbosus]|uniref:ABC-type xenobiotic transporter n=1 Tax=Oedothorax gibbosus TaxID=931172 RepID=A0AAV6VC03_9ARAC|nr:hypothetical protein JTE90_023740 [Oedothorax gibbosus]
MASHHDSKTDLANITRSYSKLGEDHLNTADVKPKNTKLNISDPSENGQQNKLDEKNANTEDDIPPVGIFEIFKFSSTWDKVLLSVATIVAIAGGALWPAVMIMFGNALEMFISHASHSNTTLSQKDGDNPNATHFLEAAQELCTDYATVGFLILVFNYLIVTSFSLCAANQAHRIKCLFMSSILKQDISWFDTHQTADFASRLTGDLNKIQDGIGEKVGICIYLLSNTTLCIVCGLYFGWKLALVTLTVTPVLALAMGIISKVQASVSGEESKAYAAAGAIAEEALSSIRTVIAFGGEHKEMQRYDKLLIPARRKGIKKGVMTSIGAGLTWFTIFIGYALSFWYGVHLIVQDSSDPNPEYTPKTLIIVFSCIMSGTMLVGQTAPYFEAFATARGAAGKIFDVIKRKPHIDSSSNTGEKQLDIDGNIELKNVSFNYPARPDVQVLKDISLTVRPGETVALVGSSGCGKSTIVQLILRFYDASMGCIEIDGKDVKCLNVGWLRSIIGFVGQEPVLFSTTIAENIRYGKDDASQEDIEQAAKLANVHEFISSLPLRYDTLVGDHGTQLSGGQKQRIAVARALIKNPKILLLDEATSALDSESESVVQAALDKARLGRTTIIVAHRLSTIRSADKICVLSEGVIKEVGNHDELMEKKELYYNLVLSQMNEVDTIEGGSVRPAFSRHTSVRSFHSHISNESGLNNDRASFSASVDDGDVGLRYIFKDDENKNPNLSWMRLLRVALPDWPFLVVGAICSFLMGLCAPIYGVVFGGIIGALSEDIDKMVKDTAYYCIVFLLLAGTSFIFSFLQIFMFSVAAERLTSRLRSKVFSKIITQSISYFDHPKNSVGSLCSKLTSDASDMQGATGSRVSTMLQAFSTLIACVALAVFYNYKIGCLVFAFVPLIVLSVAIEGRVAGGQLLSDRASTEAASKVAVEAIESIRTVAALHQEKAFYQQFCNAILNTHKNARKRSFIRGFTFGLAESIQVFAYATAFYYGSVLFIAGELKYADLYRIIEGIIIGTAMLGQAVAFTPDYQKSKLAAARIFEILDLKSEIDIFSQEGTILGNIKGSVKFQAVQFRYPSRPNVEVLKGLDLQLEPGKTVALVGSSGCGKSTCMQLMERFYNIEEGQVLLDDVNIKDVNVSNLRSHMGLVSQEPVLFSYSIAENIAYGKNYEPVDMNQIIEAARKANIHDFITSLPQGYETPVGLKGTQLSGGQKQRVAIARALLRDPKILLLDEATSALDAESERIVQEALDNARSGRTCLVIAHRLTTIQNADCIAVLNDGKIIEQGSHQELLKLKGHYYKLYTNKYSIK